MKITLSILANKFVYPMSKFFRNLVNSHPYLWYFAWRIVPYFKVLLPHDKSYKGFLKFSSKSGLFLDVGANNGISALGFNALLPNYRIFSVEANPQHFSSLSKIKNKINNFDFIIAAAGDCSTSLRLNIARYKNIPLHTAASVNSDYMNGAFKNNYSNNVIKFIKWDSVIVDVIPLDNLNLRPDFIKIDVEGYDYEVLIGLRTTINNCRPILLIEFSHSLYDKYNLLCVELNYQMYVYSINSDSFIHYSDYIMDGTPNNNIPLNVYFIPNETHFNLD
jgi:FkbM family methyltransferase